MTKFRRTISYLLVICSLLSFAPLTGIFAGADSCVHVPGPDGRCVSCGTLLVSEEFAQSLMPPIVGEQTVVTDNSFTALPAGQVIVSETVVTETVVTEASETDGDQPVPAKPESTPDPYGAGWSSCRHEPDEDGRCRHCDEVLVAAGENGVYFTSMEQAFAFGGNIRLLTDIRCQAESDITVTKNQTVSLDLNGKKLGVDFVCNINNYGMFTLSDSQDDQGELYGGVFTRSFEDRAYNEDGTYLVTDCAYGAKTVITGGRILGDVTVSHDEGREYYAGENKPNPSLEFAGGVLVWGRVSVPDENRGEVTISGGAFGVEPPAKYIIRGFEARKTEEDEFFHILLKKYVAGWEASSVQADPTLPLRAREVACGNSAVNNFYTDELGLADVSDIIYQNGLSVDPETDRISCSLEITASEAVTSGEGPGEKVTGMSFLIQPVCRVYHGGQFMSFPLGEDSFGTPECWGSTMRFPVDGSVTNKFVNIYSGDVLIQEKAEILSDGAGSYVQLFVNKGSFVSGIRYEVYVPESCTLSYDPCGAGDVIYETVPGGSDAVVPACDAVREHHSFSGWLGSDGVMYYPSQVLSYVIDDLSFTAVWTPDTYGIFYQLNGGENSGSNPFTYAFNDTVTLAEPVREGALFRGWYETEDFSGEPVSVLSPGRSGDVTLYARWVVPVTFTVSGDGSGSISDQSRQYLSGDSIELAAGESVSVNIFNADGSYISAVRVNGEEQEISNLLTIAAPERSVAVEVEFSLTASENEQIVDFSQATAENGGELSSALLSRVESEFEKAAVADFNNTGVETAIDASLAREAFAQATGETIGENDTVNSALQMSVLTVSSDDGNRITGYQIDVKPVMTVVSAEGFLRHNGEPVVVPNGAITSGVTFRIPIDSLAYMDDIVAFHEGELMGYFKIKGESPNRYAELTTDSFSKFEVRVILGSTNHPEVAIGQNGFTSLADAINSAGNGDVIYILLEDLNDVTIPDLTVNASLNGEPRNSNTLKSFMQRLSSAGDTISIERNGVVFSIKLAREELVPLYLPSGAGAGDSTITVVYAGNGGYLPAGEDTVVQEAVPGREDAKVKDNSDPQIGFVYRPVSGEAVRSFIGWNTQEDGKGDYVSVGKPLSQDTTLFAVWGYTIKVSCDDSRGSVVINGAQCRDGQVIKTLPGANAAVQFIPNDGCGIKNVLIDGADQGSVTFYRLNAIAQDHTVAVTFVDGIAELYDPSGNYLATYRTLREAYDAAGERYKIRLIGKPAEGDTAVFGKELLIECNGYLSPAKLQPAGGFKRILYDSNRSVQIRKLYKVNLEMDGGTYLSSSQKYVESYRDTDLRMYPAVLNGATFGGWFYDKDFTLPLPPDSTEKYNALPAVAAPGWPEEVTIYARWVYIITVYNNNYGYVEWGGRHLNSGEKLEVNRHSDNLFTFHPFDGYRVYNVTVDNIKQGERYKYDFNDVQANHILVVTFARGNPTMNPYTGDGSSLWLWITLMGASASLAAALLLLRRKKRQ